VPTAIPPPSTLQAEGYLVLDFYYGAAEYPAASLRNFSSGALKAEIKTGKNCDLGLFAAPEGTKALMMQALFWRIP
jgi:hypothetical protein